MSSPAQFVTRHTTLLTLAPGSALSRDVDTVLARHLPRHRLIHADGAVHAGPTCPSGPGGLGPATSRALSAAQLRARVEDLRSCACVRATPAGALLELARDVSTGEVTQEWKLQNRTELTRRLRLVGDTREQPPPPSRTRCCTRAPLPTGDRLRDDIAELTHRICHARADHRAPDTRGADTLLAMPNPFSVPGAHTSDMPPHLGRIGPWAASPGLWIHHLPAALARHLAEQVPGAVLADPATVDAASWPVLDHLTRHLASPLLDGAHERAQLPATFTALAAAAWDATH